MDVRLELNGDVLDLCDGPYDVLSLDIGDAEPRAVVTASPDVDGVIDTTSLVGARTVTMLVQMTPLPGVSLWQQHERLRRFTSVRSRPLLVFRMSEDAPWIRIPLRHSGWSTQRLDQFVQTAVLQWSAPLGVFESAELHETTVFPGSGDSPPGVEFDVEFDVEFPAADPPGTHPVVNAGNFDAYPVFRVFGPCGATGGGDPIKVSNLTTGRDLVFDGLEITAGNYLEVDTRAKTIRLNGLASESRYDRLVFPDSEWWTLVPGENVVAFRPDTFSGDAQLLVRWRSAWL